MKWCIVSVICCGLALAAYSGAEGPRSQGSHTNEEVSAPQQNKNQSPAVTTQAPQSEREREQRQECSILQWRKLKAENEDLRKALQSEREKNLKNGEALNSLRRIADVLGVKITPETSVAGLESEIRIKLDSKCYAPKKRLTKSQLILISDLLADEPALFRIIEKYHQFILSLDGGQLILLPDTPKGN